MTFTCFKSWLWQHKKHPSYIVKYLVVPLKADENAWIWLWVCSLTSAFSICLRAKSSLSLFHTTLQADVRWSIVFVHVWKYPCVWSSAMWNSVYQTNDVPQRENVHKHRLCHSLSFFFTHTACLWLSASENGPRRKQANKPFMALIPGQPVVKTEQISHTRKIQSGELNLI